MGDFSDGLIVDRFDGNVGVGGLIGRPLAGITRVVLACGTFGVRFPSPTRTAFFLIISVAS